MRGRVASLLEVGTGFHPELTGRENVYLNGSILGMRKAEIGRKFDAIVAFAEIEKFLDTPVKRYSSGMYVRLAFSVAAHLEPEILVVDEVLAVGDFEFQKKCIGKMQAVASEHGRTVLFVSHNMAAVRSLCDSCYVIDSGRLVFHGEIGDGVDYYLRRATPPQASCMARFRQPDPRSPWMRSASLMSSDGVCSGSIPMGSNLRLAIEFASPQPLRYPRVGFVISGQDGHRILNANNRYQSCIEVDFPCTAGTISCDLGMVPLMPGRYTVSLWFGDHAQDTHVEEDALVFEVIEWDIWGKGKVPPKACASLWWPTHFEAH
jgi:lipopolysaccharide transport system ATP-binding protein